MKTLTRILTTLDKAGELKPGLHLRIENKPWQALVIEYTGETGPDKLPVISVAHYSVQEGDMMRDPEVCFELARVDGKITLWAYYFRNDYANVEQLSRQLNPRTGELQINPGLQRQHRGFATLWDRNLTQQGFWKAFVAARAATHAN